MFSPLPASLKAEDELVSKKSVADDSMLASPENSFAGDVESEQLANKTRETVVMPLNRINFFVSMHINISPIHFFYKRSF